MARQLDSEHFDQLLHLAVETDIVHSKASESVHPNRPNPSIKVFVPDTVSAASFPTQESRRSTVSAGLTHREFQALFLLRLCIVITFLSGTLAIVLSNRPWLELGVGTTVMAAAILGINALACSCLFARPSFPCYFGLPYFLMLESIASIWTSAVPLDPFAVRLILLAQCTTIGLLSRVLQTNDLGNLFSHFMQHSIAGWGFLCAVIGIVLVTFRHFQPSHINLESMLILAGLAIASSVTARPFGRIEWSWNREIWTWVTLLVGGGLTIAIQLVTDRFESPIPQFNMNVLLNVGASLVALKAIAWGCETIESTQWRRSRQADDTVSIPERQEKALRLEA